MRKERENERKNERRNERKKEIKKKDGQRDRQKERERERMKTRPDTRPIPVADGWAGAEMRVFALSQLDDLNEPTGRPTDGQGLL